jgi:hypothetical protein
LIEKRIKDYLNTPNLERKFKRCFSSFIKVKNNKKDENEVLSSDSS